MSRRRAANRAEAIVRGVGAILLLLLLLVVTRVLPSVFHGKSTDEMIGTMFHIIMVFAMLTGLVVALGLAVWVAVRNRKR